MYYNTEIDTIVLKIDCKEPNEQREIVEDIKVLLQQLNLFYKYNDKPISLSYLKTIDKRDLIVYHSNTILAVIKTGFAKQFYITIEFAGLKSYNTQLDEQSNNYLLRLASYLNSNNIPFKIIELDICLDIESNFKNILSVCVKRQPKVEYYKVDKSQKYESTLYLEKIEKEKLKSTSIRSYQYDKSKKENIQDRSITRFEIKIQPKYFINAGEDISKIEDHLKRYYTFILVNKSDRNTVIKTLNKGARLNKTEKKLLEQFRVNHDIKIVENFITNLRNVKLDTDLENRRNKRDKQLIDFNFFNKNQKNLSVENFIYTN